MFFATIIPPFHSNLTSLSLLVVQWLVCVLLCIGGVMKLTMPVAKIAKMFAWTGEVPKPFLRFIGVVDLAGGLGILLPTLTYVLPQLTAFAALGGVLLQLLAIGFHTKRGEIADTPFNFFLLVLCGFVLWGRR